MSNNVANRVAASGDEGALAMVDQAIDTMVAASRIIEENLPKVKVETVPEKAAIDNLADSFDNGVVPYLTDMVKSMSMLGG